jgi:hypothetical protein
VYKEISIPIPIPDLSFSSSHSSVWGLLRSVAVATQRLEDMEPLTEGIAMVWDGGCTLIRRLSYTDPTGASWAPG